MKLTEEEHEARAMLLGMESFYRYGYYRKPNQGGIVDADTLEELDAPQMITRVVHWMHHNKPWSERDDQA